MALLHAATISPTKDEVITSWLTAQSWAPAADGDDTILGSYRLDDPAGEVGLEVHLVERAGTVLQVPLTYRNARLDDADEHLAATMEHSVLGTRYVYDGLHDPVFTRMLAGTAMTGCGPVFGMVVHGDRWLLVPMAVELAGGGWDGGPVAVDGFEVQPDEDGWAVLRNDRFDLRVARAPVPGARPAIGLTGTWTGQDDAVVLAEVVDRSAD